MVHFYRAAPQQPKDETQLYLMYGLLAVAVILGGLYFYRRHKQKKQKEHNEKDKHPATHAPSHSPSSAPSSGPTTAAPSTGPTTVAPTRRV